LASQAQIELLNIPMMILEKGLRLKKKKEKKRNNFITSLNLTDEFQDFWLKEDIIIIEFRFSLGWFLLNWNALLKKFKNLFSIIIMIKYYYIGFRLVQQWRIGSHRHRRQTSWKPWVDCTQE